MTREKLIDQIKKLLALAASPNENEAKSAMAKALELMAKYSVEIAPDEKREKVIIEHEYVPPPYTHLNGIPFWPTAIVKTVPLVASTIAKIFGVYSMMALLDNKLILLGFPTNIEVAKFAIDSVLSQGYTEYRVGYQKNRSITFAEAFWLSFARMLKERFEESTEHAVGLVVYDPIRQLFEERTTGRNVTMHFNNSNAAGVEAGRKAGESVQLRQGIQSKNEGKLLS